MTSTYEEDIVIKSNHRFNMNKVIKMVQAEFRKFNLRSNPKKNCGIMKIMQNELKKNEIKEDKIKKFINQL
jgi:hypothetical protein